MTKKQQNYTYQGQRKDDTKQTIQILHKTQACRIA